MFWKKAQLLKRLKPVIDLCQEIITDTGERELLVEKFMTPIGELEFFFVYWSVLFNISRTVCGSSRSNGPSCPMLIILIWPPIILGEPPFRSRVLGIPREGNLTKILKYFYSRICNGVSIKTSLRLFT